MWIGKLQVVPFLPEHLGEITPRSFERDEMVLLGDFVERARQYLKVGPAYTGIIEGQIMVCAGVLPMWKGVAEIWSVTTDLVTKYPLAFHRAVSRILTLWETSMDLWRIQVAIHVDHHISQKWIQRLGFRQEGKMPGYGPDGATYIRFGRVKTEDIPCHF